MKASCYQERFWLDWQTNPQSSSYNESLIYQIDGDVNLDLIKGAIASLMHKHPMLRSQFYQSDIELKIHFIEENLIPFEIIDIGQKQISSIEAFISSIANKAFNLTQGPLWHATLIRISDERSWLVFVFHHIIIDGNSYASFRADFSYYYNNPARENSRHPTIVKDPTLEINRYHLALSYYTDKLADKPLRYDFLSRNSEAATFMFSLGSKLSKEISQYCLKQQHTLFRFISTVFAMFLYQYFGRQKFCIGYPVNMRGENERNEIGSFINMQLLPLSINQNYSFQDVLSQIIENRRTVKSFKLPFEKLIDYLKRQEVLEPSDAINCVISETDLNIQTLELNGLKTTSFQMPLKDDLPYDLALEYQHVKDDVYLRFTFKVDCLNLQNRQEVMNHFNTIAAYVCQNPTTALYQFPLIDKKIALKLIRDQAETDRVYLSNKRINQVFDEVVLQQPDAIAIIDSNRKVTYFQLAQMANLMAINLINKLTDEIDIVGISMPHSIEMIALMLALFKLGRAYVPIHPDLPEQFANNIIKQSGVKLIVTDCAQNYRSNQSCDYCQLQKLLLENDHNLTGDELSFCNSIAYILFTSGTTGKPKALVAKHTSVVNLISSTRSHFSISAHDVIPWFHSYAFDFSVWEIWSSLLNGATLLVLNELDILSPGEFTNKIARHQVTVINQTPTALKQWINYLSTTDEILPSLKSVRFIISGGEALYAYQIEALLLNKTPLKSQLFNMYGISEDTIHSTCYELTVNDLKHQRSIIGKVLPGKYALVIDENDNIRPIGVPGELLLSGFGVSHGYLNDKYMTQSKFVKLNEDEEQQIWFRTGDYVKVLPTGELEYLGRKDTQIKIRGYRIDYKDVEARLSRLPGISSITILPTEQGLVGFFMARVDVLESSLKEYAKSLLPGYMRPSRFIKIDALPLTRNHKIDTTALLQMANRLSAKITFADQHVTDLTVLNIKEIWETVLPSSEFGIHDNFYDCGGNSILLNVLRWHMEQRFSIKLPIIGFFNNPTIIDMARMVSSQLNEC